ncbi:hypothetical protein [Candidatus Scalindua japonica]|uniref:hypothetical protein n=1 Tax=Candidatus Scalindua japonica TaxID=1284222 RepID=UPI0013A5AF10|nr:hypothetical protein [Candidatus Scalindua japonica]
MINSVSESVSKRGIWMIDRGGDRKKVFDHLLDNELRFLIRVVVASVIWMWEVRERRP